MVGGVKVVGFSGSERFEPLGCSLARSLVVVCSLGVVAHFFNSHECKPSNQPVECVITGSCPDFSS
jgi:hypothetical protein